MLTNQSRKIVSLLAILTFALVACGSTDYSNAIPAVTQTQFSRPPEDIRNYRYCEIIPVFRSGTTFYVEVYNTIGHNECPAEQWEAINEEELAAAYGAIAVKINGPRYWVINEIAGGGKTAEGKTADFGGIEMKMAAVLETKLWEGTAGESLYTDNEVQRTTTFTYHAGAMVYELTSPEGDVYRMQSYAQIVDPTLTIDDLEMLGERLELPEDWRYQTRVLSEKSELIANGLAYVISDDFGNTYQKVTP